MIDIMKRSDGKYVAGYRIRFLSQAEIDNLYHSTDGGYSVEIFENKEDAVKYYGGDNVNCF